MLDAVGGEQFDPRLWLCAQGRAQDCAGDSGGPWFDNARSGPVLFGTDETGDCNPPGRGGRLIGDSMPTNLIGDVPWIVHAAHINAPPGTPPTPPRPVVTITPDLKDRAGNVIVHARNRPRNAVMEVTMTAFGSQRSLQFVIAAQSNSVIAYKGYSLLAVAYVVQGEYGPTLYFHHY